MSLLHDTYFVVGIAIVLFFAIIVYYGVHKLIINALDERAKRIRDELDEARRLREDAQKTFAEFERKQREVQGQADEIIEHARIEAERNAERAKKDIEDSIERKLRAADEQIEMAEREAIREVKDRAVQVAIAAAAEVMQKKMTDDKANALIDNSIETVGRRLN